jgi:hypothetical protein
MNENKNILVKIILVFLAIIFWPITLVCFFIWLMYFVIKSEAKRISFPGNDAEYRVNRRLQTLDENEYTVFHNICLPSNGNTEITQIDHIVVSRFGIFCIETKGQSGWIFGSKNRKYWTEVIYRNKYRLYNPIWQNYAHIKAIEYLIGDKLKAPIVPFLVFPNSEKIKVDDCDLVGNGTEILDKIRYYSTQIYDIDEYIEICNKIDSANITDKEALKIHNNEVRSLENK